VPPARHADLRRAGADGGESVLRGACWTLHPDACDMFADGCFLRRPRRFQSRPSTKNAKHSALVSANSDSLEHGKKLVHCNKNIRKSR